MKGRVRPDQRALIGLIAAVSVFSITLGFTYPLIALQLEAQGVTKSLIGLNAAMTPLGMIVSGPIIPRILRRVHAMSFMLGCIAIAALLLIGFASIREYTAWLVFRFLLGVSLNGLFTVGETGLQEITPEKARGRVMGIYNTIVTLGYSIGPILLSWTGSEGWMPFLAGLLWIGAATVPLLIARRAIPDIGSGNSEIHLF